MSDANGMITVELQMPAHVVEFLRLLAGNENPGHVLAEMVETYYALDGEAAGGGH